jgi:hypothetical protein
MNGKALARDERPGYQALLPLPGGRPGSRDGLRRARKGIERNGMWLKSRFSMSERKKARQTTGLNLFSRGEIEETEALCPKEIFSDN